MYSAVFVFAFCGSSVTSDNTCPTAVLFSMLPVKRFYTFAVTAKALTEVDVKTALATITHSAPLKCTRVSFPFQGTVLSLH